MGTLAHAELGKDIREKILARARGAGYVAFFAFRESRSKLILLSYASEDCRLLERKVWRTPLESCGRNSLWYLQGLYHSEAVVFP